MDATLDRFLAKFTVAADGCWVWTAATVKGYGHLRVQGRDWYAHRFSYEQAVGPIPDGLQIDHLCQNKLCVNPDHLEPVTARENMLRGDTLAAENAAKAHCKNGHEFTPENTYVTPGTPWRSCRTCRREIDRRRRPRRASHATT